MERKSNITIWQLRLFEGLNKDIMVMQRNEEEVFDDAIHVFFEKEYYDAYVNKAKRYGEYHYAYHEDKLGEVIYQIFDENITGLVLHINTLENGSKTTLCDEKYLSAKDLRVMKEIVDSYHYMYRVSIDRCTKEEAVAHMLTKSVFIIGKLPDFRKKPAEGEKQTFEIMTMKRKKDKSQPKDDKDYDYESLKVFLTAESAMRYNPDKKPINKYKLSLLAQFVKGHFQVIVEPHRNYWLEFDPATLDISAYFTPPVWNEEKVKARICEYANMEEVYILLGTRHSDYRTCLGTPFLLKLAEENVQMYLFEKYEDAVNYCLENPTLLPVFDGTYPIGVLKKNDKMHSLQTALAVAAQVGVTSINLDDDTLHSIHCKFSFFMETAGFETDMEKFLTPQECSALKIEKDGTTQYRFEPISFVNTENPYAVSKERREELASHLDTDYDEGITYMAECSVPEMIVMLQEAGRRFEAARTAQDEEKKKQYNRLMNRMTVPLTEALCEKPFVFTLREQDGSFTLRNQLAYLIVTNRFEGGRTGEGRLTPAGIDNEKFMEQFEAASKVAAVTDGPDVMCLADVHLMGEIAKQWKHSEPLREELMIYLTQGCKLSYVEALHYYKRLKSDSSIFVEFTSTVRNAEYPPMGMITIEGYTAKKIAEEKNLSVLQAYDALLALKEHPKAGIGEAVKEAETITTEGEAQTAAEEEKTEEKKSFFGKLFKK